MTESLDTSHVRQIFEDASSYWRVLGIQDALLLVNRLRKRHFTPASGEVLDVACGTGENFRYLSGASRLTAFDISDGMMLEARRRVTQMGADVGLLVADSQETPFRDNSFDTVISAFSSCTFPDYATAFQEMTRVTRPGGRVLLLEHGRSSVGWIARRQDRNIDRVYERSGCRNNRDVIADLAQAGLEPASITFSHLGMMSRVTIEVG